MVNSFLGNARSGENVDTLDNLATLKVIELNLAAVNVWLSFPTDLPIIQNQFEAVSSLQRHAIRSARYALLSSFLLRVVAQPCFHGVP